MGQVCSSGQDELKPNLKLALKRLLSSLPYARFAKGQFI